MCYERRMPAFRSEGRLVDYQRYVAEMEQERGFSDQSALEKCLLLGEEVGELYKAVRKETGLAIDERARIGSIADELADVFIYVCSIANRFDVDLEAAFRTKEEANRGRAWANGLIRK